MKKHCDQCGEYVEQNAKDITIHKRECGRVTPLKLATDPMAALKLATDPVKSANDIIKSVTGFGLW